jgi:hypothetical protein
MRVVEVVEALKIMTVLTRTPGTPLSTPLGIHVFKDHIPFCFFQVFWSRTSEEIPFGPEPHFSELELLKVKFDFPKIRLERL